MKDCAVLIPTKGRPEALVSMFKRCPELNCSDTYIGIEPSEKELHVPWRRQYADKVSVIWIANPKGFVGNAREQLRHAVAKSGYKRYLLTDDNSRFNSKSLQMLLLAQATEGCIMEGMGQPSLWHQDAIAAGKEYDISGQRFTTFVAYSTVHWVVPSSLYDEFTYPVDCFNDDVYFALWSITTQGYTSFRMCLEAKYSKKRFEPGGNGSGNERLKKMALGMYQLATDFPQVADNTWMSTNFRWKNIIEQGAIK